VEKGRGESGELSNPRSAAGGKEKKVGKRKNIKKPLSAIG